MVMKKLRRKYLAKVWLFSAVWVSGMVEHVTLTLQDDNPDNIILYTGTNDLRSEKTPSQISKSITELEMFQQFDENSILYCPAIW